MNGATCYDSRKHLFAGGLDDECHLFSLKYRDVSPKKTAEKKENSTEAVKRKTNKENSHISNETVAKNKTKLVTFEIEKISSFKTDFCKDGGYQKCVQFSPNHSLIATGGADGHLRVWKTDDLTKIHDIKAHQGEIDDLDFSPKGDKIVTISLNGCLRVWNTNDGKKHLDMEWPHKAGEHRFRACRFGVTEKQGKDSCYLYTINIPVKRQAKPDPCFLAKWDGTRFTPKLMMDAGLEVLSSMAISDDGIYIGVGMMTGSVAVYIAFSLQKLYYVKEVHSIFVTGLEFMPMSESARAIMGCQDFTLLSISADNTVRVHQEPPRSSYNVLFVLIGFIVILVGLFWIMAELGL